MTEDRAKLNFIRGITKVSTLALARAKETVAAIPEDTNPTIYWMERAYTYEAVAKRLTLSLDLIAKEISDES